MADLTKVQTSLPVVLTDSSTLTAKIRTTVPSVGDEALAVREVQRGQQLSSASIPVVLASDQSTLPVSISGSFPSKIDDSAFSIGVDSVSPSGFLVDETATDSADEGDVGLARMTLDRKLLVRIVGSTDSNRLDINSSGQALVRTASEYAEDQTAISSDIGTFVMGVRNDNGSTTLTSANGDYSPISVDSSGRLILSSASQTGFADGNLDAFGRLRASEPFTIFDSKFTAGSASDALFWDTSTATGGTSTFNTNQSTWDMAVTTTNESSVIRQTRQYFSYQPGKSMFIFITGVMGAIKANVRQRIGYFDASNGIFFEQDGTNLKVVRRTFVSGSAVDNAINQSSWNIDKLDGTGASGITLDMSKTQIFVIDLQWLGVGRVRLGFDIDGKLYYCHQFLNANSLTEVYMTTPCLPIRYEITNTGTSASSTTMKAICSCVLSESGYNPLGVIRSAVSSSTAFSYNPAVGTYVPVISIRLKSTSNRVLLDLISIHVVITNTSDCIWRIEFNPTLTGASWTSVGTTIAIKNDGIYAVCTKTTTTNIDYVLPGNRYLSGANWYCKDTELGDYFKFKVIDLNNILGYGAGFTLSTWVDKWYVASDQWIFHQSTVSGLVYAGLCLRAEFTSVGILTDPKVFINYHLALKL